jgi:hypothetical protein
MEKHWLIGECFVSLIFTVAVFWREILTVDVKVKKIILKSFMYCLKLGFFRLIFGLPPFWPLYLAFCRLPFPRQSIRTSPLSMFGMSETLRPSQLSRLKTSSLEILDTISPLYLSM